MNSVINITKKVYCPTCGYHKNTEGGIYRVKRDGRKRFLCSTCRDKIKNGIRD